MTPTPSEHDPVAAFTEVLNEVLDVVQEVKQAYRILPANHELHDQIDRLFGDMVNWARQLIAEDEELGASPLADIPSFAGRTPPNLWRSAPTDDEIRRTVLGQLDMLAIHLSAALEQQDDVGARAVLEGIQEQLIEHLRALSD